MLAAAIQSGTVPTACKKGRLGGHLCQAQGSLRLQQLRICPAASLEYSFAALIIAP